MTYSRRDFLRAAGVAAGSFVLPGALISAPQKRPVVALGQADRYDRALIRQQVTAMLDRLGGLGDIVRPGDRVVLKTNLTGGVWASGAAGMPATDSYVTHPEVVRALGEAILDSGAGELYIVESVYDAESFPYWGHTEMARHLGATLIDLNQPDPAGVFVQQPVGEHWQIYPRFTFNRILLENDVFISVAKMKCHASCGVTHSMKNLVGLIPMRFYQLTPLDGHRSALHGLGEIYRTRLPRVVLDLNMARPIDFALIDGVKTSQRGEGPWVQGWGPVEPGVLVAGKNAVAVDSVATAVMGFDPMAASMVEAPFRTCLNHLHLAALYGLGTNDLDRIDIVGADLDAVRFPFEPYEAV